MSDYVRDEDMKRILSDTAIATEALLSIREAIHGHRKIHKQYLKEKVATAQRCLTFLKNIAEGE